MSMHLLGGLVSHLLLFSESFGYVMGAVQILVDYGTYGVSMSVILNGQKQLYPCGALPPKGF